VYSEKMRGWKLNEISKVRVPSNPSGMIGPKISSVEMFCFAEAKTARRGQNQNGRMRNILI